MRPTRAEVARSFPATAYELPPPPLGHPSTTGLHLRTRALTLDGSIGGGGAPLAWVGVLQVLKDATDDHRKLTARCGRTLRRLWRFTCRDPSTLAGYRRPYCTPGTPPAAP